MKKKYVFWIFWALMFVGALVVVSRSNYSDGDDAFFYQYTHSMGFFEYLGWRYNTWVGRLAAEALVYLTFSLGIYFWRVVNALMLVLLPIGILRLAAKAARIPEGSLLTWKEKTSACQLESVSEMGIGAQIAAVSGYFLMSVVTVGYAALWVNGSIFYTWCFTCGIWALMPFADFVFAKEPATGQGQPIQAEGCGEIGWKRFLYTIPCAVIGAMSIEQMGAVLVVFEILAVLYGILKWRKVNVMILLQTLVTIAAFAILFAAPGNEIRVASEIINWMPEYETMPFGQHFFITAHWLLASFANENKLFLCGIWLVGIVLLMQKKNRRTLDWIFVGIAAVFTVAALLPYVGVNVLSDFGMQYINTAACVYPVPTLAVMTGRVFFAMTWWAVALIFTFVFLWRASGCQITLLLAYLAGLASEMIMFFSPTMYASGARVYYLTDLLYLFIILALTMCVRNRRTQNLLYGILGVCGVWNIVSQVLGFYGVG